MEKKFITFLTEHNALKAYGRNLYKQQGTIHEAQQFIKRHIDAQPNSLVSCAFIWSMTREGNKFWTDIDFLWNKYCEK